MGPQFKNMPPKSHYICPHFTEIPRTELPASVEVKGNRLPVLDMQLDVAGKCTTYNKETVAIIRRHFNDICSRNANLCTRYQEHPKEFPVIVPEEAL